MVPKKRELTFKQFSEAPTGHVLVCTDVAARGIDLPDIDIVIQVYIFHTEYSLTDSL